MSRSVRIRGDIAAQVEALALAERRPFANAVEVLLLAALHDRVDADSVAKSMVVTRAALTERGSVGLPEITSRGGGAPTPVAAPRSVSADVPAKVPGVTKGVPAHMRGDRPMLECSERVVAGNVCGKCGRTV